MAIRCPNCYFENPSDTRFCGQCATPLHPAKEMLASPTETMQAPIKELTTGSTFAGRYQVIEELGKGGMGKVYKVFDTKIKEKIALKLIKPEIASDRETIERFSNELKLARKIRHKNVCGMFDIGEAEGAHFITMEYVGGEDLKTMIRMSTGLTVGTVLSIGRQVCHGLAEAHSLGVVHRDLKPQNIIIDKGGNAKIMDFGIARSMREKGITGGGIIIGTPEYMSPEQTEAKDVDQRSDIYSLGVVLYEMATGRVPFEGETALSVAIKHKTEIPKDPRAINPNIPDDLRRLILRCLEKDKAKRYQNAAEVLADFEKIEKTVPGAKAEVLKIKPATSTEITIKFRAKKLIVPGVLLIVLVIAAILVSRSTLFKSKPAAPPPPAEHSVAVLPFVDLSAAKEYEYLGDGIAETLINALSASPDLRVPARTSAFFFKDKSVDIKEIGQKLGVATILEGSIQVSRDRLRVTSQLINIHDGYHLWSEKYDRSVEDVFAIQDDIAQRIVEALKIKLLGEKASQIVKRSTSNPEAYNLYTQGLYFYNKRGSENLEKAIEYLKKAIEIDPNYALAHAQLAETYDVIGGWGFLPPREAFPRAKEAALKALEIDSSLAEAHSALADMKYCYDWDWKAAEEEFKRSFALNPNYAVAHLSYGQFLGKLGRFDEAREEFKLAQKLDPLSLIIRSIGALYLSHSGQHDPAIEELEEVLKMDPNFGPARRYLRDTLLRKYLAKGLYKEAIEVCQESNSQFGKAVVYARMGRKIEAKKILDDFIAQSEKEPNLTYSIARLFFALEDRDQGFQWLEKAYEYKHRSLSFLKIDPDFISVRDDPRFLAMLRKVGLGK